MSIADEIEKLNTLKNSGAISEEEFQDAKRKLLQGAPAGSGNPLSQVDDKIWSMLIHLSLILGVTGLGVLVPVVMWLLKKNDSAFIDQNGKNVVNWIITAIIAAVLCAVLIPVYGLGLLLLNVLYVVNVVLAIIGAIKAYNGELWPYPIAIKFIK